MTFLVLREEANRVKQNVFQLAFYPESSKELGNRLVLVFIQLLKLLCSQLNVKLLVDVGGVDYLRSDLFL